MSSTIWTEKYRPSSFKEIIGQESIVSKVKAFVEQKNMPHLMFVGPAGVGKTTLSIVVAKELFGENWKDNLLELNASDERGIDVIRNKVKDFARTRAIGEVPFKIIYLDECDALTKEAQQALRRTMENSTQTCRFILSCNYSSKIIDPIQSRCVFFRFQRLSSNLVKGLIEKIAKDESLTIDEDAKNALFQVSEGDCRKLENIMQSCAALNKTITKADVYSIASVASPEEVIKVLEIAVSGKFIEAKDKLLKVMLEYGLSGIDVIKQIEEAVWKLDINNKDKVKIIDKIGEIEFRMVEGSDEFIQLEALLAFLTIVKSN